MSGWPRLVVLAWLVSRVGGQRILPVAANWMCPLMAIWPLRVVACMGCGVPLNGTYGTRDSATASGYDTSMT